MILKLMGLVKQSDLDKALREAKFYRQESEWHESERDSLLIQNIELGEAYEDLKRDRDRLAKKLKAPEKDTTKKSASIVISLKADSGYTSKTESRISADQWSEICKIIG